MFGTRNPEPGKGEGKKIGKKEKSREGKIKKKIPCLVIHGKLKGKRYGIYFPLFDYL